MARFIKYLKFFILMSALIPAASCSENNEAAGEEVEKIEPSSIVVSRSPMVLPPGMETLEVGEELPIINPDFTPSDILYISQMGTEINPSFESGAENLYLYKYYENEEETPTWDQGFNFELTGTNALNWRKIVDYGSVGNAFSFYAMYFPGNTVNFSVKTDQTGGSEDAYDQANFLSSDILGAYHTTSATYTRLRFNLFHLMVYLKVTVYVPDYSDSGPDDSDANTPGDFHYSGFREGALRRAFMLNTAPAFTINWRGVVSSDTEAPPTQTTGSKTNIQMYMHQPDPTLIENFQVRDYYTGGDITTDVVRAYNFSVLFPTQSFAQNSNLLCFELKNPVGDDAPNKYYYFSAGQLVSETTDYALSAGTLQNLYLYLPRETNKTILIGANILQWGNTNTEMTVTRPNASGLDED